MREALDSLLKLQGNLYGDTEGNANILKAAIFIAKTLENKVILKENDSS